MFKNLLEKFTKKESKRSVGRPRLADESLKKNAKITMALAMVIGGMFTIAGISVISGKNPIELLRKNDSMKLQGAYINDGGSESSCTIKAGSLKIRSKNGRTAHYEIKCTGNAKVSKVEYKLEGYTRWQKRPDSRNRPGGTSITFNTIKDKFLTMRVCYNNNRACSSPIVIDGKVSNSASSRTTVPYGPQTSTKPSSVQQRPGIGNFPEGTCVLASGKLKVYSGNKRTASYTLACSGATVSSVQYRLEGSSKWQTRNKNSFKTGLSTITFNTRNNKYLEMRVCYNNNKHCSYGVTMNGKGAVTGTPKSSITTTKKLQYDEPPARTTQAPSSYCTLRPVSVGKPGPRVTVSYRIYCYNGAKVSRVQYRKQGVSGWTDRPKDKFVAGSNAVTFSKSFNNYIYMRVCYTNDKYCTNEVRMGIVNTSGR